MSSGKAIFKMFCRVFFTRLIILLLKCQKALRKDRNDILKNNNLW